MGVPGQFSVFLVCDEKRANGCVAADDLRAYLSQWTPPCQLFEFSHYFPFIYTLTDGVMIEARSCSTSIVPASVPFAPLVAPFLWWLPFDDHYQNYVRRLRRGF